MIGTPSPDAVDHLLVGGLAAAVVAPLVGATLATQPFMARWVRPVAVASSSTSLVAALVVAGAWRVAGGQPFSTGPALGGGQAVFVDGLSAALLPYAALIGTAVLLVAPRRALDAAAVKGTLLGLSATLALFATAHPFVLLGLWFLTAWPTWRSTRGTPGGRAAARVFAIYMSAALGCMTVGTCLLVADPPWERPGGMMGACGGWFVAVAVLIRKGIVPFHSWYPALFSGAPMSTALMATMPQVAAYTAVRLLVGHAEDVPHELEWMSALALCTAVYGAALALVQRHLRGFIGAFSMSQSALVLAGLSGQLPLELTGAFCVWISSGLAITGIGLVSWALESRAGDISLDRLEGRFWDAPALAAFFLLFGMAAIGLPGTLSFVADDLIVAGSLDVHLAAGFLVIASAVLCGIATMRSWFHVFGGPRAPESPNHAVLGRERLSFTVLLASLFVLGVWPEPLVQSLEDAAEQILHVPFDDHPSPHDPPVTPHVP